MVLSIMSLRIFMEFPTISNWCIVRLEGQVFMNFLCLSKVMMALLFLATISAEYGMWT